MKLTRSLWIVSSAAFIFAASFSACSKADTSEVQDKSSLQLVNGEHPTRGPENALLSVEQFSDFQCPYCKEQAYVLKKVLETYPGKVQMTFRHMPISGQPGSGSFPLHEASMCAAEQGKFWEFHDFVFGLDKKPDLDEIVLALSLDKTRFDKCSKENRYRNFVLEDTLEAQKRGVAGAPTFFIQGEQISGMRPFEFFAEKLDPELAQKMSAERKKAEDVLLSKISPSEAGRPASGSEKALVTITEFSDFHCRYCAHLTQTLNKIMETYPQDLRRVWRHYPLPMHPYSPYAHVASECAHEQGQFWAFHGKIFQDPAAAHSKEDFERIGESVFLDKVKFQTCYEDEQTKKKIENDVLLGMFKKVASTPTIFINDEMVIGAKSFEDLKTIIDRKLKEAKE